MALEAGSRPIFPDSLTSLITFSRNPIARTARYVSRNSVITQHVTNSLTSLSLYGLGDKVTTTVELKVYLTQDLDSRFRKAAMSAFGYGRGSLSKAAAEALARWCSEREGTPTPIATSAPTDETNSSFEDVEQDNMGNSGEDKLRRSVQPAT